MPDLEKALYDSSRRVIDQVTETVWKNKALFKQALDLALSNKHQIANRAVRVVYFSAQKDKSLVSPYISQIVNSLDNIKKEIVQATFLQIFLNIEFPNNEDDIGLLADFCFRNVQKITNVASNKLLSMEILYKISNIEPELKPELISIIEDQMPKSLTSFRTRGRKILKKLFKETGQH